MSDYPDYSGHLGFVGQPSRHRIADTSPWEVLMYHRVRVLCDGQVQTVVHVEKIEDAHDWAYVEMRVRRARARKGLWAATVESGRLLVDPLHKAADLFLLGGDVRDGLVLDKRLLEDPNIDLVTLFGLSS